MHALSHTLAHRGPGASRTRTRWQPYSSTIAASTTPTRSPANYLNTPASSVSSSPPSSVCSSQSCHIERARKLPITQSCHIIGQSREAQKNRYVSRLVDQAVNSLCDMWHPDDIPIVFRTSSRTAFSGPTAGDLSQQCEPLPLVHTQFFQHARNLQLPSPVSPFTQASPFCPSIASTSNGTTSRSNSTDRTTSRSSQLLPLKGFVHEVLRRSRTSTGVLQTALCYLEAVRGKIPELLRKENSKTSGCQEDQPEERIIIAAEFDYDVASPVMADEAASSYDLDFARLVGLPEPLTAPPSAMSTSSSSATPTKRPSAPLPPLPPLPSPLLCPRRTFLACLILASKFIQDRSYSNRAWAKLAGLPAREISRCERALGEALDWRLWVGKASGRKPVRSRSESDLTFGGISDRNTLRRNATAPASVFASFVDTATSAAAGNFFGVLPQVVVEEPEEYYTAHQPGPSVTSNFYQSMPGDATELIQDQDELSPPLSTPTLSYSPMSCISSSSSDDGERTIQMSAFLDLPQSLSGPTATACSAYQGRYDVQDRLKAGAYASSRGYSAHAVSNVVVMDGAQMPPMSNPAAAGPHGAISHGPVSLPSLYEVLGGYGSSAFGNSGVGYGQGGSYLQQY